MLTANYTCLQQPKHDVYSNLHMMFKQPTHDVYSKLNKRIIQQLKHDGGESDNSNYTPSKSIRNLH